MKKTSSLFSIFIITFCVSMVFQQPVSAYNQFLSDNDILFYKPGTSAADCIPGTSINLDGSSLPPDTIAYLDSQDIKGKVEANKDRYNAASAATGVPWQAIAALHYREGGMGATSSVLNGEALAIAGQSYTETSTRNVGHGTTVGEYYNVDNQLIVSDPIQDAINGANHFKGMAADKSIYGIDIAKIADGGSVDEWGKAFLAYNRGHYYVWADVSYARSPYVMNGYDSQHAMWMSWPDVSYKNWHEVTGVNKSMGALTIMSYLGGVSLAPDCETIGSGIVKGKIVETAVGLALMRRIDESKEDVNNTNDALRLATDTYKKAIVEYDKASATYPQLTDCGRFVATVMIASGVDPDFPKVSVNSEPGHIVYHLKNSGKYKEIQFSNNGDNALPGDILAADYEHILIYTGPVKGSDGKTYHMAQASYTHQTPNLRATSANIIMTDGAGNNINSKYKIYRLISA